MRFPALTLVTMLATLTSTAVPTSARPSDPPSSGAAACTDLTRSLSSSSTVLTPSSSAFSAAQNGGFNPLNQVLAPSCIVQPTTTAEVSSVMRSIFTHNAPYAVRAGGHTGMAGWDGVAGGVLIDFSKMTGFSFNPKAGTVTVEPGLRWGDIYNMSEPHGVAPMGGRVEHVGTGLILGGGLSLLSPQYGYACDGLVSATVVMVDGTVKHVNAQTDPQLLRAIKGGGGRFGVVTQYELKAFPTGTNAEKNWFGGSLTILTDSGMDELVKLTEQFVASPDDPRATLLSNVGMLKQNGIPLFLGSAFLFYHGTAAEFNKVFAPFLLIPGAIPDFKPLSYQEAAATTPLGWAPTQAYKWIGGSLYPNPSSTSYLNTWGNIKTFLKAHEDVIDSGFYSLTPVKTVQIAKGYEAGGNAISPPQGRSYVHYLFSQILASGTTSFPADFEQARQDFIKQNPSDKGLPLFLNEVDAQQNAFQSYGWYGQLKDQYKKADPTGFSLRNQQGPVF